MGEEGKDRRSGSGAVTIEEAERRFAIALNKMTARQADIFLSVRFDDASYEELAARHGVTVDRVMHDFARAVHVVALSLCPLSQPGLAMGLIPAGPDHTCHPAQRLSG